VKADEYKGWDVKGFNFWYEFLDTIALKLSDHREVYDYAYRKGVIPFSTPTSPRIVDFLESIGNEIYKIASMDVTNIHLLKKVAATGKPVIMSTGMASDDEILRATEIFKGNELVILHCVSDYPTQPENVNLLSIPYLAERYNVISGFSDHALTNEFAVASIAVGARVIEKHITYSRKAKEKAEHHFALEPQDFREMVNAIRNIEQGMGKKQLMRSASEMENKIKYRRSLHLNKDKKEGDIVLPDDIAGVRPAIGADISDFDFFIGKQLTRSVQAWSGLKREDVK
jgi:pseudaminic acid synthase